MTRNVILGLVISLTLLLGGVAFAQPAAADPFAPDPGAPDPFGPAPAAEVPQLESAENARNRNDYPTLRLVYYAGYEGRGWKEVAYFDLDEWTSEKDVIITATWIEPSGLRSAGASNTAESRRLDPFKARHARRPQRRAWKVEYADAATEGESHIFVNAPGLPRISERILHEYDTISFLHIPTSGWHQLGAAARAARYVELETPPPTTVPNPSDTRSR